MVKPIGQKYNFENAFVKFFLIKFYRCIVEATDNNDYTENIDLKY